MGTATLVVLMLILFIAVAVRRKMDAIGRLTEELKKELKEEFDELKGGVTDLRGEVERLESTRRPIEKEQWLLIRGEFTPRPLPVTKTWNVLCKRL